MVPEISFSQLLSPETTLKLLSPRFSDEALHDFFRDHPDEPLVDAWLLANLERHPPRAQAVLRIARKAHAYWRGADDWDHLLFGVPLTLTTVPVSASWRTLRGELEHTLGYLLQELQARVQLCARPLPSCALHLLGATGLGQWCEALYERKDPSAGLYEPGKNGAAVWVGLVSVPRAQRAALEQLFFGLNPEMSRLFSGTNMRLEALAEEQGADMRMYAPTAYWNSLSIARLVHARRTLAPFKRQAKPWTVRLTGSAATLWDEGVQVWRQPFPEESKEDFWPLFSGWAREAC